MLSQHPNIDATLPDQQDAAAATDQVARKRLSHRMPHGVAEDGPLAIFGREGRRRCYNAIQKGADCAGVDEKQES